MGELPDLLGQLLSLVALIACGHPVGLVDDVEFAGGHVCVLRFLRAGSVILSMLVVGSCANVEKPRELRADACAIYVEASVKVKRGESSWHDQDSQLREAAGYVRRASRSNDDLKQEYEQLLSWLEEASRAASGGAVSDEADREIWNYCAVYLE